MINLNDKRFFFINIDLIKDSLENKTKKNSNSEFENLENLGQDDIPIKKV